MDVIRELNAGDIVAPKIPNPDERGGYPIDRAPDQNNEECKEC